MFMANQLIGFGAGQSFYNANAVAFDGSNDYLLRGADLTGNSDGTDGTLSCWVKINGANGTRFYIGNSEADRFNFYRDTTNKITLSWFSGAIFYHQIISSNDWTSASGWFHVLCSWNTSGRQLYINDASDVGSSSGAGGTIDYTRTEWAIGANDAAGNKLNGDLADFWLSVTTRYDLSVEANRRKFISAAGKPVNLGSDGSAPGVTPIIFLSGATATWHTNKGSGGGFTENGALTDAASSPSD